MAVRPVPWMSSATGRPGRRWGLAIVFLLTLVPTTLAGLSWWLTVPLDEPPLRVEAKSVPGALTGADRRETMPDWPRGRLEGEPAKALLLATLLVVQARLERVEGYTATFRKQERIHGILGPEQTLAMKVRQRPFAVYFKFISPA